MPSIADILESDESDSDDNHRMILHEQVWGHLATRHLEEKGIRVFPTLIQKLYIFEPGNQ